MIRMFMSQEYVKARTLEIGSFVTDVYAFNIFVNIHVSPAFTPKFGHEAAV